MSSRFRKSVAQPIVELAQTAQKVTRDKDYSIRMAQVQQKDELAVLVDSFNEMLKKLQKSHDELEQRVQERTRELLAVNREVRVAQLVREALDRFLLKEAPHGPR